MFNYFKIHRLFLFRVFTFRSILLFIFNFVKFYLYGLNSDLLFKHPVYKSKYVCVQYVCVHVRFGFVCEHEVVFSLCCSKHVGCICMVVIIKSKNIECLDFTLHCLVKSVLKIKKGCNFVCCWSD